MGIPTITGYPLPGESEVPGNNVDWQVDPNRAALLIHDMQQYFLAAFDPADSPIPKVVENIDALRRICGQAGIPVFYTAQPGNQDARDRGLQRDVWGPGMVSDPAHTTIEHSLAPTCDDIVVTKWRYSAFQRTNLEARMRARGRDQLIVTGVYAHIGCLLTTAEAFMRDIQPFFVIDGVADFSREKHDLAMAYVAGHCGALSSTDRLLNAIAVRTQRPPLVSRW